MIAAAVESRGATPAQTLSRVLQELRRLGILHHVERGIDLLLDSPISADAEDYPDRALDIVLRRGELLIEEVPTGDARVLARRRRGQSRLRALTLSNYSNQCGLCDVLSMDLLIASRIVRWGDDPAVRGASANVLCLCRMHDALFEFGYISVRDDLAVLKKAGVASAVIGYLQNTSAACESRAITSPPHSTSGIIACGTVLKSSGGPERFSDELKQEFASFPLNRFDILHAANRTLAVTSTRPKVMPFHAWVHQAVSVAIPDEHGVRLWLHNSPPTDPIRSGTFSKILQPTASTTIGRGPTAARTSPTGADAVPRTLRLDQRHASTTQRAGGFIPPERPPEGPPGQARRLAVGAVPVVRVVG